MAERPDRPLIDRKIRDYVEVLKASGVKVWRVYLYGSHANGTSSDQSDIDLAIFLDLDDLDGFEEDALLMKLRRKVDLSIEPHAFARSDLDQTNPYIEEIITTGERIL